MALPNWTATEPYLNAHCLLGEGPFHEVATNTLRFVDIKRAQLLTVSLDEGPSSLRVLQLDAPVSITADVEEHDPTDKILLGLKFGIALLDRHTGKYEYLTRFAADGADDPRLRANDGAVDPHGRFWLGSMTDFGLGEFQPEGSLFRFDGSHTRTAMRLGLTIPNAIAWSPDRRTMYFTHSAARTVFAFDYDPEHGHLSNERVFYQHPGQGEPDGMRVDTEGNLWHAVFGEGRVLKISPTGDVIGEVLLPTRNITCVQFVGPDLFITTAADDGQDGPEPRFAKSKEYGGAIFRVTVGAQGLTPYRFKVSAA